MKKILALITLCLLCVFLVFPSATMASPVLLVDEADVLTADEEADLLEQLSQASAKYNTDIAAVTVTQAEENITDFTDAYLLNNGYGRGAKRDAILLLVDVTGRNYHFSTHGQTIYAFTDAGIAELGDQIKPYLSNGDYASAFQAYCDTAAGMIDYKNVNGHALYEADQDTSSHAGVKGVISVIIGFLISLFATGKMKGDLKTVRTKTTAAGYFDPAGLRLTAQKDTFLYHNVTRIPINNERKESGGGGGFSTHSGGGSTFGGGGGSF